MAYVTQGMRRKMADAALEARHPERAQERVRYRKACGASTGGNAAKFPVITPESFAQADRFQNARIAAWASIIGAAS